MNIDWNHVCLAILFAPFGAAFFFAGLYLMKKAVKCLFYEFGFRACEKKARGE